MVQAIELIDGRDPRVASTWQHLEARTQPSYFLSWGWIENWLASLPAEHTPKLAIVAGDDGAPAAAFFLGRNRVRRHVVMPSNALYFNASGSPRHDEICIEHNGLLAAPGTPRSLAGLIALLPGDWDELFLPGIDRAAFDDLSAPGYRIRIDHETASPFIDLEAVRGADGGYLGLLGSSTRAQIRRARRAVGASVVEIADDEASALAIYDELVARNRQRWQARSAFADPWFEVFHRRLIRERLGHGEIQLVRVRAGGKTIGCLYNFVFGGRVLFYQSGLAAFDDPHIKPGYLCHAEAVEYNARAGHAIYDLLGGDSRYKRNLATGANTLVWLRVQRRLVRFSVEDRLRRWKRALVAMRPALALRPV